MRMNRMKTNISNHKNRFPLGIHLLWITLMFAIFSTNQNSSVLARRLTTRGNHVKTNSLLADIKIPKLEIKEPSMAEDLLPSGAFYLAAEDSSLPFLTLTIYFDGGLSAEPVSQAGNLDALSSLMQLGGAGDLTGEQFAEELSRMGARINVNTDYEYWSVSMTCLKNDFDRTFQLMSEMLLKPKLPADRLTVIKNTMLTRIKQRNDDPAGVAQRKIIEIMYPGSRLGYTFQTEDVNKLDVESLRSDLQRRLSPKNAIIAVSGDLNEVPVKKHLNELFQSFPEHSDESLTIESPLEIQKENQETLKDLSGKIVLVKVPARQAVIVVSGNLPGHNHPDFFALQMSNYILGGGSFNSRLMREIRAKRGLAYYSYSGNTFYRDFGRFYSTSGTRVEQAHETLNLMLELIDSMHKKVSQEEVQLARDSILNSLVFQYENPDKFIESEARFRRHNMPGNYMTLFAKKIREVKFKDVKEVSQQYLQDDQFLILVAGPEELKDSLSDIRPVEVIDPEEYYHAAE